MADAIVSMTPNVMPRPVCGASAIAAVIRPLSPSTTLRPSPASTLSPSVPAITTSSPSRVRIVSAPPIARVQRADEIEVRRVAVGAHVAEHAVVAEHQVVAGARVDRVVRRAADDDVVAVACEDGVVAADARVDCRDDVDRCRIAVDGDPVDEAAVAQDDVVACVRVDRVAGHAAEHDVLARAGEDAVVTADADAIVAMTPNVMPRRRLRRIRRRRVDPAAVAEHHVATLARVDLIAGGAADDDVVAVAGEDRVAATDRRVQRRDDVEVCRDAVGGDVVERAAVAEDQVVAARQRRIVSAGHAAEDDVGARAGHDAVVAADGRRDRRDQAEGHPQAGLRRVRGRRVDPAAVAEHHVAALAGVDHVAGRAADHHVVAVARDDQVAAADRRIERGHEVEVRRRAVKDDVVQRAVVTEHEVVAGARVDRVVGRAAEHDVGAPSRSRTSSSPPMIRRDRRDHAERHAQAGLRRVRRRRVDPAAVAEHDVAALAGVDHVAGRATDHDVVAVGRDDRVAAAVARVQRRDDIEVGRLAVQRDELERAVVAKHQVVARCDVDHVVGGAAEDDVGARAGHDARRRRRRSDRDRRDDAERHAEAGLRRVRDRRVDPAAVAEHHVAALAGVDHVARRAADHHVVAVARA